MLRIENIDKIINQRIVLNIVRPDRRGTYYILNTWRWLQEGNELYYFHLRHINKLHSDVRIVLNRFKTGEGYILWDEDNPNNSMLVTAEQMKDKQTFLKAIELIMVMK